MHLLFSWKRREREKRGREAEKLFGNRRRKKALCEQQGGSVLSEKVLERLVPVLIFSNGKISN